MLRKNVITIAACASLLLLVQAGDRDTNLILSCWHDPVTPNHFEVDYYFSSRSKTNVKFTTDSNIGNDIDFDFNRKTVVLVHGYLGNSQEGGMDSLRDALITWQDVNVIAVDWRQGGAMLSYIQAAANTATAAIKVKSFIRKLVGLTRKPFHRWNKVHLIGFSLGAHVVGQIGAALQKVDMTVDRITGLDPAEPCFDDPHSSLRLKKTNARFVDVIHTDAAESKNEKFGLRDAVGHADFYINGGSQQPGCPPTIVTGETKREMRNFNSAPPESSGKLLPDVADLLLHASDAGYCHHLRAVEIFLHTLFEARKPKGCRFWAHPWSLNTPEAETSLISQDNCDELNCAEAGINADRYRNRLDASYYVKTTGQAPYCLKKK